MNIIYIRTSTEEQNPENQLKDCQELVDRLELKEVQIISEQQSAFKDNKRDKFNEILKLIKQKKVDNIICWDWDRLFRNRKKLKEFFESCKIYKCNIHSFRQGFFEEFYKIPQPFNEIMQDLFLNLLGWMAEDESVKKSDRIRRAIRMKDDGAYSYKENKWGRKELSTQAINKIIELRKQGKTYREIQSEVKYSNKNNMKNVSMGLVHKILSGKHRKNKLMEVSSPLVNL